MFIRLMLWRFRDGVLELDECLWDIVGHVQSDGASGIVPIHLYAAEQRASPIPGHCVVFFQGCFEMHDVVGGGFNAKIVHDEAEDAVVPHMAP